MAEDGRPSKRGHCWRTLPLAVVLTLAAMVRHPKETWKEAGK